MRNKILGLGFVEMLRQAPTIYSQLDSGIRTDLSLDQIIQLATASINIPKENINNTVLDQNYVSSYRTPAGASVLVPMNEQIAPLIQELFYSQ